MHHTSPFSLPGTPRGITLRQACAADAAALQRFVQDLDATGRYLRFHGHVKGCSADAAARMVRSDGAQCCVWLAFAQPDDGGAPVLVGEARWVRTAATPEQAELALVVAPAWRHAGVADQLLQQLVDSARAAGVELLFGSVLAHNARMLRFMARHGFAADAFGPDGDDPAALRLERTLLPAPSGWRRALQALALRMSGLA